MVWEPVRSGLDEFAATVWEFHVSARPETFLLKVATGLPTLTVEYDVDGVREKRVGSNGANPAGSTSS
jgi:hypothetical protein